MKVKWTQQKKKINLKPTLDYDPDNNYDKSKHSSILIKERLVDGLCGVGMGTGLHVSGMVLPQKIWGVMNLSNFPVDFDPALLFTFCGALAVHAFLYHKIVMKKGAKPWLSEKFEIPTNQTIDKNLIGGSMLFGMGWGIGGLCPGPAIAGSGMMEMQAIEFSLMMFVGYMLYQKYQTKSYSILRTLFSKNTLIVFGLLGSLAAISAMAPPLHSGVVSMAYWAPLLGGGIIGFAVAMRMIINGKILGNTGLLGGLMKPQCSDASNRLFFLTGCLSAGFIMQMLFPVPAMIDNPFGIGATLLGGLLVGFGTSMANGCTSGHGIAGMSRLSRRSILATAIFCGTCVVTSTALFSML